MCIYRGLVIDFANGPVIALNELIKGFGSVAARLRGSALNNSGKAAMDFRTFAVVVIMNCMPNTLNIWNKAML